MPGRFVSSVVKKWSIAKKSGPGLIKGLKAAEKRMLLSSGSMTAALEGLTGEEVGVEIRLKGSTRLTKEAAEYLSEPVRKKAIERVVWLTSGGRRLMLAKTLIPAGGIDASLLKTLEKRAVEPLGRVLGSSGVRVKKSRLELALVKCPEAARGLGLKADTVFTARRYLLTSSGKAGTPVLKASVTEVFGPSIMSAQRAL